MWDWMSSLFGTEGFPARWDCGTAWTPELGWTHIVSDTVITLAYVSIPITLALVARRRRDLPRRAVWLLWLFSGFIFSCGLVHLTEAMIFEWPVYRFSAALKVLTASFSVATAVVLVRAAPAVVALPFLASRNERLRSEVRRRRDSEKQARRAAQQLRLQNAELERMALRDPLTGLANRRGMQLALDDEVQRGRRSGQRTAAVLVDLDDFKSINDTFGHDTGDEVLVECARRILECLRATDSVARVGGDEFLLLLTDSSAHQAVQSAERIRERLTASAVDSSSGAVELAASFAVAELDGDERDVSALLRRTTGALHASKAGGKDRIVVGGSGPTVVAPADVRTLALDFAIQPIVDLETGEHAGQEYFVRPSLPEGLGPVDLFRAAREQACLVHFDLRCLAGAVVHARARDPGNSQRLHFNVVPETLATSCARVVAILAPLLDGTREICLEIHESMLGGDPTALIAAREHLAENGILVAIDDVGFGRSSLEALIMLEPDVVKIDRRIVHGAADDPARRSHLRRLLRVVETLECDVVAEGVESEMDRVEIGGCGVKLAQGFLLGRPRRVGSERAG